MCGGKFTFQNWGSLIFGKKFTVFLCLTLYYRTISKYKPPGAYIWGGDLTEGFLRYEFGGPVTFGGSYTFSEFYRFFFNICRCSQYKDDSRARELGDLSFCSEIPCSARRVL